jgi:cytoskeletal protein RodZ
MSVRCEECSYENLPQHSFCGMCGAKLPSAQRVEARAAEKRERSAAAQPFSRPSLLGLAAEDEPTEAERVTYLLDDEPPEHRKSLLALLLLLVALGVSGWHWRGEIRTWIANAGKNPNLAQTADANSAPAADSPAAATTASAPPQPVQPTPTNDGAAQNASAEPTATGTPDQTVTQPGPAVTDAVKHEAEALEEPIPSVPKPALKPAATKMEYKMPAKNDSADALAAQGEDYLYGQGVEPDCGRAGKSLLTAAAHSSAKAQSLLGTMYATGHCVTRDLPAAYRWYAKASHQDPGNVRIQRDLEVLWAQMTAEEREVAMKAER